MHAYFTNDAPARVGVTHPSIPEPIFFATREAAQVVASASTKSLVSMAAEAALQLFNSLGEAPEGVETQDAGAQGEEDALESIVITVGNKIYLAFPIDGLAGS